MSWHYTPYIFPLLLPGVIAAILTVRAWRHAQPGAVEFVVLMSCGAVWSLGHVGELMGADLPTKFFWVKFQYFGSVVLPVAWLAVGLRHAGKANWMTRRAFLLLLIVPMIALVLVWTNEWHALVWREMKVVNTTPFPVLSVVHGPAFWVLVVYSYVLVLAGGGALALTAFDSPALYFRQRVVLLLALAFPSAGLLYIVRVGPSFDLTPFAFAVSCLVLAHGVFRYQLVDMVPLARISVVDVMRDAVIVLDGRNRVIDLNAQAEYMLGTSVANVLGRPVEAVFVGASQLGEHLTRDFEGEVEIALDVDDEGRTYWAQISVMRNHRGIPIIRLIVCHDITARKRAEEALAERQRAVARAKQEWERTFDSVPDLIAIIDDEFRIVRINQAMAKRLGLSPEECVGQTCYRCVHGTDEPPSFCPHAQLMKDGQGHAVEINVGRLGGDFMVLSSPLSDDGGRVVRAVHVAREITELKRAEEERRRLEAKVQHTQRLESLGVLAGGVAHDFNSLLIAMVRNVDLALQELSDVSPARAYVEEVDKAARRAAELTRQMLAYSGRGRFVIKPMDLSEVVQGTAHLLESSISRKVALRMSLARDLDAVDADAAQMQQIVTNLLTNASEAFSEDEAGVIALATGAMACSREYLSRSYLDEHQPEGDYVYIEVCDTGCGMNAEIQARIFDPFFSTKFAGRGLGLAATLGIVRGHHGAVMVDSEPGKGTCVRVLLPVAGEDGPRPGRRGQGG